MSGAFSIGKIAIFMIPVFALSAAPSVVFDSKDQNESPPSVKLMAAPALLQMSTGEGQLLIAEGDSAFARNLRIPLRASAVRNLSSFAAIEPVSGQYDAALTCMTQAIYYEAANEAQSGKQAVAQVVINRLRHPSYPNSVCGVVYQGANAKVCQFSFTCDGALTRKPMERQWGESLDVARQALAGRSYAPVGTATHYHADYVVPRWAYTLSKLKVVGRHIFYRFPGSAGEPASFNARWTRAESVPTIDYSRFSEGKGNFGEDLQNPSDKWVPGLTVEPDPADRHASNDVGGRLDTTKQWRLTIPDPVAGEGRYNRTVADQRASDASESASHGTDEVQEPAA